MLQSVLTETDHRHYWGSKVEPIVGEGASATVYKGILPSGGEVFFPTVCLEKLWYIEKLDYRKHSPKRKLTLLLLEGSTLT